MLVLRSPKRVLIDTAGQWRQLVPRDRWGIGRSVTALAERWTTSEVPEVIALCESRPATRGLTFDEGWVALPEVDLAILGTAAGGRTLLAPLGLADEPLGPTVEEALLYSQATRRGAPQPVEQMARAVFGVPASVIGRLRQRLLSASAGALAEARARGCAQAVLVLHELRSATAPRQTASDQTQDADDFVRRLSHGSVGLGQPGLLAGPLPVAGNLAFYIGRAVPA